MLYLKIKKILCFSGVFLSAALFLCPIQTLFALPSGLTLIEGMAQQSSSSETKSLISSKGPVILQWNQFCIEKGEVLSFEQSGEQARVLNRVIGHGPSRINGLLSSNGPVYLLNSHGVFIGPEGRIETASFIASALDVLNADFLDGTRLPFFASSQTGAIVNLGTISCSGGDIALLAKKVVNEGTLLAPNGKVGLGVGTEILVQPKGETFLWIKAGFTEEGELENSESSSISAAGKIQALASEIKASSSVYAKAIRMSGLVQTTGIEERDGEVYIVASQGSIEFSGKIEAGCQSGNGVIEAVAPLVSVKEDAILDVSAPLGAGRIRIGGDYGGKSLASTQSVAFPGADSREDGFFNAEKVIVHPGAHFLASPLERGDGGTVALWADQATVFAGTIEIGGGAEAGNGGFAEVSAPLLHYSGLTRSLSPNGSSGTLLLDPTDVTISVGADAGNSFSLGVYTFTAATSTINTTNLNTNLTTANVVINTSTQSGGPFFGTDYGSITVDDPISWSGSTTLTLIADSFIAINADITNSAGTAPFTAMNFTARGDNDGGSNSGINIASGVSMTSANGNIILSGVGQAGGTGGVCGVALQSGAAVTATAGDITFQHCYGGGAASTSGSGNNGVLIDSATVTAGGNITFADICGGATQGATPNNGIHLTGTASVAAGSQLTAYDIYSGIGTTTVSPGSIGFRLDQTASISGGSVLSIRAESRGLFSQEMGMYLQGTMAVGDGGSVTLYGIAGGLATNSGAGNEGIRFTTGYTLNVGSLAGTNGGTVTLTGIGGNGTGGAQRAVNFETSPTITFLGTGTKNFNVLNSIGGSGGNSNVGLRIAGDLILGSDVTLNMFNISGGVNLTVAGANGYHGLIVNNGVTVSAGTIFGKGLMGGASGNGGSPNGNYGISLGSATIGSSSTTRIELNAGSNGLNRFNYGIGALGSPAASFIVGDNGSIILRGTGAPATDTGSIGVRLQSVTFTTGAGGSGSSIEITGVSSNATGVFFSGATPIFNLGHANDTVTFRDCIGGGVSSSPGVSFSSSSTLSLPQGTLQFINCVGASVGTSNVGVRIDAGSTVTAPIIIGKDLFGGAGVGTTSTNGNYGLSIQGQLGTATLPTTTLIDIQAGSLGTGSFEYGIQCNGSIITGANGVINLNGRGGGVATSASQSNIGINIASSTTLQTGTDGVIQLTGIGGVGTLGSHHGVFIASSPTVTLGNSTSSLTFLNCTGGSGGNSNAGVRFDAGLTVGTGILQFQNCVGGYGATIGSGTSNYGVIVNNVTVTASTILAMDISGGAGAGSNVSTGNFGFNLTGSSGQLGSASAPACNLIEVQGNSLGSGAFEIGINFGSSSLIVADGGKVLLQGIGGGTSSGPGSRNIGIRFASAGPSAVLQGGTASTIQLTGIGGQGSGGLHYGISVENIFGVTFGDSAGILTFLNCAGGSASSGSGANNRGVYFLAGTSTINTGNIVFSHCSGGSSVSGGSANNSGIYFDTGITALFSSATSILFSDITGGVGGNNNRGIDFNSGLNLTSGTLKFQNIVGGGPTGTGHIGLRINGVTVTSTGTLQALNLVGGPGTGSSSTNGCYGLSVTGTDGLLGGTGLTSLEVTASSLGMGSNEYGIDLSATGTGGVQVGESGTISLTGTGGRASASAGSNYGISIASSISAGTSSLIQLTGTGGQGLTGSNYGISATSGSVSVDDGGSIIVTGKGGGLSTAVAGASNFGISLAGTTFSAGTTAGGNSIQFTGIGGKGAGGTHHGVNVSSTLSASLFEAADILTFINCSGGIGGSNNRGISFTGGLNLGTGTLSFKNIVGGGAAGTTGNVGLFISGVTVTSTGTLQALDIVGGPGTNTNYGLFVTGTNGLLGGTELTNLEVIANSLGQGSNEHGINLSAAGTGGVQVGDNGTISLTGTGGGSSASAVGSNYGISIASPLSAGVSGVIQLTGTGGQGISGSNKGIRVSSATLSVDNGGSIVLTGMGGGSSAQSAGSSNNGIELVGFSGTTLNAGTSAGGNSIQFTGIGGLGSDGSHNGISILDPLLVNLFAAADTLTFINCRGGVGGNNNCGISFAPLVGFNLATGTLSFKNIVGGGSEGSTGNVGLLITSSITSTGTLQALNLVGGPGTGSTSTNGNYGLSVAGADVLLGGSDLTRLEVTASSLGMGSNEYGIDLSATGTGGVQVGASGTISLVGRGGGSSTSAVGSNYGISIASPLSAGTSGAIQLIGTGGGGITGSNYGISATSGSLTVDDGGSIALIGNGGGSSASSSGASNFGISLAGTTFTAGSSAGSNSIQFTGTGGLGSSGSHHGVNVSSALSASLFAAADTLTFMNCSGGVGGSNNRGVSFTGALNLGTGTLSFRNIMGGGAAGTTGNVGLFIQGVTVTSTGTLQALDLIGGPGTGSNNTNGNYGLFVRDSGGGLGGSELTRLEVTAYSLGQGDQDAGIRMFGSPRIEVGASGMLSLTGTGGGSSTGSSDSGHGIFFDGGVVSAGNSGVLQLTGMGGQAAGGSNFGIRLGSGNDLTVGNGGSIILTGIGGGLETGSGSNNHGISFVDADLFAGSSAGGNSIQITGIGGKGSGGSHFGINSTFTLDVQLFDPADTLTFINCKGGVGGNNNRGISFGTLGGLTLGTGTLSFRNIMGGGEAGSTGNIGLLINRVTVTSTGTLQATDLVGGAGTGTNATDGNYGLSIINGGQLGGSDLTEMNLGARSSGIGSFEYGMNISSGSVVVGNGGSVFMQAMGGGDALGASAQCHGVYLLDATVTSGSSGALLQTVAMSGKGGKGSGGSHRGVFIDAGTLTLNLGGTNPANAFALLDCSGGIGGSNNVGVYYAATSLTMPAGLFQMSQVSGGSGGLTATSGHHGFLLPSGVTFSPANLTMDGIVSGVGSGSNFGSYINGGTMSSSIGSLQVSGFGISSDCSGVVIDSGGSVACTMGGDVSIVGETDILGTYGILVTGSMSQVTTDTGAITLSGQGGEFGCRIEAAAAVSSTDGTVTIDGVAAPSAAQNFGASLSNATISGSGSVAIRGTGGSLDPTAAGVSIDNGSSVTSTMDNVSLVGLEGSTVRLGDSSIAADIGSITVTGDVTLVANATFSGSTGIDFQGTINGAFDLIADAGTGTLVFEDSVGSVAPVTGFTTTGAAFSIGGDITTASAPISMAGPVTLTSSSILTTGGASIAMDSVDGTTAGGENLTFNPGAASIAIAGDIGTGTALGNIVIESATTASFGGAVTGLSLIQEAGSGATTFDGAISTSGSGGISLTGTSFILNASPITLTGGGSFQANDPVTLGASLTIDSSSGEGDVVFADTVDSATGVEGLLITTGLIASPLSAGAVVFSNNVGAGSELGALEIAIAGNVLFSGSLAAASVEVGSGAPIGGTSLFADTVTTSSAAGIVISGESIYFENPVTAATAASAPITLTHTGTLSFTQAANVSLTGDFSETGGTGISQLAGNVTSSGGGIAFHSPLSLNAPLLAPITLQTDAGTIALHEIVTGSQALSLVSTSGEIQISEQIGTADLPIGALIISTGSPMGLTLSRQNIYAASASLTAPVSLSVGESRIDTSLANGAITFNGVASTIDGAQSLLLNAGSGTVSFEGEIGGTTPLAALEAEAGAIEIHADVFADAMTLNAPVTLHQSAVLSTASGAGDLFIGGTLLPLAAGVQGVELAASGSGTISLPNGAGASGSELLALNISSGLEAVLGGDLFAHDITSATPVRLSSDVAANTTSSAAGQILFSNTVDGNHALTIALGASGTVEFQADVGGIEPVGTFTISSGASALFAGASLATNDSAISFSLPVSITGSAAFTNGSTSQPITFNSTLDGPGNLTLGGVQTGAISFVSTVGATTPLGTLTLQDASSITASQTISVVNLTQQNISGTAAYQGLITCSGAMNLSGNAIQINQGAAVTGSATWTHTGTLTLANGITANGGIVERGGGTVALSGTIASSATAISFTSPMSLQNNTILSTGAGGTSLSIGGKVNGAHELSLSNPGGTIAWTGEIGNATPPTSLVNTASTIQIGANQRVSASGGSQMLYSGAISLTGGVVLQNLGSSALSITGAVSGGYPLSLLCDNGAVSVGGAIQLTQAGRDGGSLDVWSGTSATFGGAVSTFAASSGFSGGDVTIRAFGGAVEFTSGNISTYASSGGGNGGSVFISSKTAGITILDIDAHGGSGGGDGGSIILQPAQGYALNPAIGINLPVGIITFNGTILNTLGGGGANGFVALSPSGHSAPAVGVATIVSTVGDPVIIHTGTLIMGPYEAMTVIGDIELEVSNYSALSDLVATGAISISAPAGFAPSNYILTRPILPLLTNTGGVSNSATTHILAPAVTLVSGGYTPEETPAGLIVNIGTVPELADPALLSYSAGGDTVYLNYDNVSGPPIPPTPPTPPAPVIMSLQQFIYELTVLNTEMEAQLPLLVCFRHLFACRYPCCYPKELYQNLGAAP